MATLAGQIACTEDGRWPVQREFNRRMKQRFQQEGIAIASSSHTLLMQVSASGVAAGDEEARSDKTKQVEEAKPVTRPLRAGARS